MATSAVSDKRRSKKRKKRRKQADNARAARFTGGSDVSRQTRFTKKPPSTTKPPSTKPPSTKPENGAQQTKSKPASRRKWTTAQHVETAAKISGKSKGQAARLSYRDTLYRSLIRDRNRRRRYPWAPALIALGAGLVAWLFGALFEATTDVSATSVAMVIAALPLVGAGMFAVRMSAQYRRWVPEVLAAGLAAAAWTVWIGVTGVSWWTILVMMLVTFFGGQRWWRAHPVGPGVAPLVTTKEPEAPAAAPDKPVEKKKKEGPPPEKDPYCIAWLNNNAKNGGRAMGSRLTNRDEDEFTVTYDVELKRGQQTADDLRMARGQLASGLGVDVDRLLVKRGRRGEGAHKARLTIIETDPVAEVRYFTNPLVKNGAIKGVGRFVDGSGECDLIMWDRTGTVPTMIVGSTGGGKSGAANVCVCGALEGGLMNLLYADPKGNSSTAIASRARVAIIGKENVLKLPQLVSALLKMRGDMAARMGKDLLLPQPSLPGWMILHDEYSLVAGDAAAARIWTEGVNIVRALGFWLVALNQSLAVPQWGNDHARSAFATQVVAFRINSVSSSDLVPGLLYSPKDLPVDDRGRAVPGMAVHSYIDTPVRWDFLPSDADVEHMIKEGLQAPPLMTSTAFDQFFNQPEPHPDDVAAITAILGPPVNGRWQVGGRGATHEFPSDVLEAQPSSWSMAPQSGGAPMNRGPASTWQGQDTKREEMEASLSDSERLVLQIVRAGTTETGAIIEMAKVRFGRSTVMEALKKLTEQRELLRKNAHGSYELTELARV